MDVLILMGHPNQQSFVAALADSYVNGVQSAKASVQIIKLGELNFDPSLHQGYRAIQTLEPDLLMATEAIRSAKHLAFFYPQWWGSAPAILKGFIDRTFLPGFAFKYHQKGPWWDRLLTGRTAEIWLTSDSPRIWCWVMYRDSAIKWLKSATLEFSGVKPVKVTTLNSVKTMSEAKRRRWIQASYNKGRSVGLKFAGSSS